MKKIVFLFVFAPFFSCKKNVSNASADADPLKLVLSKNSLAELNSMSKEEIKSVVSYLDNCSMESMQLIFEKIKALGVQQSTHENARVLSPEQPTTEELRQLYVMPADEDPAPSITYYPSSSFVMFDYNWTVAKQIWDFYRIESKEYFQCGDKGDFYWPSQYEIETCYHKSSYISGFAPGISYQENGSTVFYNPGGYHAFFGTSGILNALGINSGVSSSRYVHAGVAFKTQGAQSHL